MFQNEFIANKLVAVFQCQETKDVLCKYSEQYKCKCNIGQIHST